MTVQLLHHFNGYLACTNYFFFLVAKGLNMYQVLAPNAYSYVDAYVSSVNKNIHSLVYERVRK